MSKEAIKLLRDVSRNDLTRIHLNHDADDIPIELVLRDARWDAAKKIRQAIALLESEPEPTEFEKSPMMSECWLVHPIDDEDCEQCPQVTECREVRTEIDRLVAAIEKEKAGRAAELAVFKCSYAEVEGECNKLQAELHKNGYNETWHICRDDKIRPYPALYCSACLPSDKVRQFNPFEELNAKDEKVAWMRDSLGDAISAVTVSHNGCQKRGFCFWCDWKKKTEQALKKPASPEEK